MGKITIYHNQSCGTSRQVLETIKAEGFEPEVIFYLETPLTRSELTSLIKAMAITPHALLRKKKRFTLNLAWTRNQLLMKRSSRRWSNIQH